MSRRRRGIDPRRRKVIKAGGAVLGFGIFTELVDQSVEVGDDIEDFLGGEVNGTTGNLTLKPGTAVEYRVGNEDRIIAYGPHESSIRYGEGGEVTELEGKQEFPDGELSLAENAPFPDYHVDFVDSWKQGDVVEPRGAASQLAGLPVSLHNLEVNFDGEVGIIERGEHEELLSNYSGEPQSSYTTDFI